METKNKILNKLLNLLFFLSILFFTIGLNLQDTPPPNGWYQQWMPDISGASIRDITFTDSLNGYIVTNIGGSNSYILKTTNGGDNWTVKFTHSQPFVRVMFISTDIGFTNAFTKIFKTTNGGENWNAIDLPSIFGDDMFVLNEDTIWLAMSESMTGGVFRTTNGGLNWIRQLSLGSQNPTHIYFYNGNIGFISKNIGSYYTRKTIDGGASWSVIVNEGFTDMYFIDSLRGWRAFGTMKETTNGGLNWVNQTLPQGGYIILSQILKFSNVNKDTIWGGDGFVIFPNSQARGIVYRTTNGGDNWLYQIPDTSIHSGRYQHVQFVDKFHGWAYWSGGGIHTTIGGDSTFTNVNQMSTEAPSSFRLFQNYPNPFNNETIINYELRIRGNIELSLYDISGKLIKVLIEERQSVGSYEYRFSGAGLSSGVYFYSLTVDGKLIDTKKAVLIK